MNHEVDTEPTAAAPARESIDAFLDREFATALASEFATGTLPEVVQTALVQVASSASPDKSAWLNAVDPPPKAAANG